MNLGFQEEEPKQNLFSFLNCKKKTLRFKEGEKKIIVVMALY